ncbi:unnamed protein product [Amoebophrya sp. A25]|nr:unnamed protein product [Amoebophrya sp. A25]|eukprot:GSA25T00008572001.1
MVPFIGSALVYITVVFAFLPSCFATSGTQVLCAAPRAYTYTYTCGCVSGLLSMCKRPAPPPCVREIAVQTEPYESDFGKQENVGVQTEPIVFHSRLLTNAHSEMLSLAVTPPSDELPGQDQSEDSLVYSSGFSSELSELFQFAGLESGSGNSSSTLSGDSCSGDDEQTPARDIQDSTSLLSRRVRNLILREPHKKGETKILRGKKRARRRGAMQGESVLHIRGGELAFARSAVKNVDFYAKIANLLSKQSSEEASARGRSSSQEDMERDAVILLNNKSNISSVLRERSRRANDDSATVEIMHACGYSSEGRSSSAEIGEDVDRRNLLRKEKEIRVETLRNRKLVRKTSRRQSVSDNIARRLQNSQVMQNPGALQEPARDSSEALFFLHLNTRRRLNASLSQSSRSSPAVEDLLLEVDRPARNLKVKGILPGGPLDVVRDSFDSFLRHRHASAASDSFDSFLRHRDASTASGSDIQHLRPQAVTEMNSASASGSLESQRCNQQPAMMLCDDSSYEQQAKRRDCKSCIVSL